jgi:Ring finger domain
MFNNNKKRRTRKPNDPPLPTLPVGKSDLGRPRPHPPGVMLSFSVPDTSRHDNPKAEEERFELLVDRTMNGFGKLEPTGGTKPVFTGLVHATKPEKGVVLEDSHDSECPVCTELYDDHDHIPVFAARCRHSVCHVCLEQMSAKRTERGSSNRNHARCPVCRVGEFHKDQEPHQFAITLLRKIKVMTKSAATRDRRTARCRGMKLLATNPHSTFELRRRALMGMTGGDAARFDEVEFFKNQLRGVTKAHAELLVEMTQFQEARQADSLMVQKSLSDSMDSLAAVSTRMAAIRVTLEKSTTANLEIAATHLELREVVTDRDIQIRALEKQLLKVLQESQEDRGLVVRAQKSMVVVLAFFLLLVLATFGGAMIAIRSYTTIYT